LFQIMVPAPLVVFLHNSPLLPISAPPRLLRAHSEAVLSPVYYPAL
jgi:hypothetical protein